VLLATERVVISTQKNYYSQADCPRGCWDNAAAESFLGALKNEMYYRQSFPDQARARFAVADYIEVFYDRQRLHSALGYRGPRSMTRSSRSR
jgi:transposase InsO family protein